MGGLRSFGVVAVFATGLILVAACGNSAEDSCEKLNDLCASQKGYVKADCSNAGDRYDKLSDADKEKADKASDCLDDAKDCAGGFACLLQNGTVSPSGSSTSSS